MRATISGASGSSVGGADAARAKSLVRTLALREDQANQLQDVLALDRADRRANEHDAGGRRGSAQARPRRRLLVHCSSSADPSSSRVPRAASAPRPREQLPEKAPRPSCWRGLRRSWRPSPRRSRPREVRRAPTPSTARTGKRSPLSRRASRRTSGSRTPSSTTRARAGTSSSRRPTRGSSRT